MLRSCLSLIGTGTLIVVLGAVAWFKRDEITRFVEERLRSTDTVELAASTVPELAQRVEAKVTALGEGRESEVGLSAEELSGWIQHDLSRFFPDFVREVTAGFDDEERLVLSARIVVAQVPGADRLGPVAMLVGDTATVEARGRVDGLELGRGIYYMDQVQVGALMLPDRLRDELIDHLKGTTATDLPVNAVTFVLPDFVADIGVRGGELLLRRR